MDSQELTYRMAEYRFISCTKYLHKKSDSQGATQLIVEPACHWLRRGVGSWCLRDAGSFGVAPSCLKLRERKTLASFWL